jgi:transposase
MKAADVKSKTDLPSDHEKLLSYSWNLTLAYQQLVDKYRKLIGSAFGKSSEKLNTRAELDALQVEMDELLGQIAAAKETGPEKEEDFVEVTPHRRRRKKHGRNSIPENLITDEVIDIPESEKTCGCCGLPMSIIDTKEHLVVERIPATYKVTRYRRPVYGCSKCKDHIVVAEPPVVSPVAKGLAGPMLLTFVLLSKYLYHLPLYRIQRQIFHESSIWFTRSTLCTWVGQACGILERIHKGLLAAYRISHVKHADESPFMVKKDEHLGQGWMWTGLTGDERIAVYLYHKHRTGAAALALLEGSSEGDYLMIDDCPSYNIPIKKFKLIVLRCMAHIRRKFVEAHEAGRHKDYNLKILIKIGQLYRLEKFATRKEMTVEQRTELRQTYSRKVLEKIKELLIDPGFPPLPQTPTGIAINYFLSNWEAATRFLLWGALPIDNTANERINRPFAIGRNNWMQAGSENGARWMAILYSIIQTCKLNNINPETYLKDVIMKLSIRPTDADVTDLLPINWYKKNNDGIDPLHTPLYPSKN